MEKRGVPPCPPASYPAHPNPAHHPPTHPPGPTRPHPARPPLPHLARHPTLPPGPRQKCPTRRVARTAAQPWSPRVEHRAGSILRMCVVSFLHIPTNFLQPPPPLFSPYPHQLSPRGVVRTIIQPERVFVLRSKERAPKQGRIGNLEKSCSGLEKSCHDMEKSGKMLGGGGNSTVKISCFPEIHVSLRITPARANGNGTSYSVICCWMAQNLGSTR